MLVYDPLCCCCAQNAAEVERKGEGMMMDQQIVKQHHGFSLMFTCARQSV